MSDAEDRVIPATPRRRRLAERLGMIPPAALPAWAASVTTAILLGPAWWRATTDSAVAFLRASAAATPAASHLASLVLPTLAVAATAGAAAVGVRLAIDGFRWLPARILPRAERIDPIAGLCRVLAPGSLFAALAALFWMAFPAVVATRSAAPFLVRGAAEAARVRPDAPSRATVDAVFRPVPAALEALLPIVAATACVAAARWALDRRRAERRLRMTPEELREELRDLSAPPTVRWARPRSGGAPPVPRADQVGAA